ncbi:MAG: LemA family protein [Pyrinomonadaceae bacterium]|nr:LemA family protein [Pyrinomonadaceae bacterium]MDQ3133593.1 LemA family protein [Acidobacteriota bacterium]
MNKRRMLLLAGVVFVSITASGCGYNTLQSKQQNVRAKWAGVESQLQRRADLIPNLFEAAKAAGIQEQQVFGDIASARSRLLNATSAAPQGEGGDKSPEQKQAVIEANNSFGGTIGRLLSLVENYPDLKSNQNFQKFQDSLEGTENRIATSRNDYNTSVQDYNTTRGSFPTVLSAKLYGFKEEPYFKAEEGSRQAPTINSESLRRNS